MASIPFVSEKKIRDAITSIYSITLDPGRLPEILDGLADVVGGKGLLMGPLSRATIADQSLVTYASPIFHEAIPDYLNHFVSINPKKNWLTANNFDEILFSDHDLIDDRQIERHSFYNDFLIRNENLYSLDRLSSRLGGRKLWISAQYSHKAAMPEAWRREAFGLLTDHLLQSLELYGRMRTLQPGEAELLDRFDCPAVILSASGRILKLNAAADGFTDRRIGLAGGRLSAPHPADATRLERLLADVAVRGRGGRAPDVIALRGDGTRQPLLVRAAPFRTSDALLDLEMFLDDVPRKLVLIQSERATDGSTQEALRAIGLTPAEARIAALIASGRSPEEAAADLGIALSTARHHVKRAHEKLGIRRQADLVRIVTDISRFLGSSR